MGPRLGREGSVRSRLMRWNWIFLLAVCGLAACGNPAPDTGGALTVDQEPPPPLERFGVVWEGLEVDSGTVQSGHSLSHILGPAGVSAGAIATIANESKDTYDVRNIRAQQPYWIAFDEDSVQPAKYYYQLQHYQHRLKRQHEGVYTYSFALQPRNIQPSGACDMSRVKQVQLQVTTQRKRPDDDTKYNLHVVAVHYNVLEIMGGMAGLQYAN